MLYDAYVMTPSLPINASLPCQVIISFEVAIWLRNHVFSQGTVWDCSHFGTDSFEPSTYPKCSEVDLIPPRGDTQSVWCIYLHANLYVLPKCWYHLPIECLVHPGDPMPISHQCPTPSTVSVRYSPIIGSASPDHTDGEHPPRPQDFLGKTRANGNEFLISSMRLLYLYMPIYIYFISFYYINLPT